jgi:branched-chain amino acid transport system permease protein
MGGQLAIDAVLAGAHYGLIALSFAFVSRTARFFHVAHGVVYALAAYVTFSLVGDGVGIGLAALGGIVAAAVAGGAMDISVFRPLRLHGASPEIQLLASFGILIAVQNIVPMIWGDARLVLWNRIAEPGFLMFDGRITGLQLTSFAISVAAATGLIWWSRNSFAGLTLRAVGDNPKLSEAHGIRPQLAIFGAFIVASAVMGLAGILEAADTGLIPLMGFRALLVAFTGALLGGLQSDIRAFLGGVAIGFFEQIGAQYLPGQWYESAILALLVAVLLLRRHHLVGDGAVS